MLLLSGCLLLLRRLLGDMKGVVARFVDRPVIALGLILCLFVAAVWPAPGNAYTFKVAGPDFVPVGALMVVCACAAPERASEVGQAAACVRRSAWIA